MTGRLRRGVVAILASATISAMAAVPLFAQTGTQNAGNGFRISPVRTEFTIEKGKSETLTLTIENPADAATTAKAVVNDFVASDKEDGEPRLILDENQSAPKNSFKQLASTISELTLAAHEKKDIVVTIKVPDNANAGGYYGAIRFIPVIETNSNSTNVGLTASVGSIVLVRVPGNLTERLDLIQMSAAQGGKTRSFFTHGDITLITRLKNEGDIHVKPFGKVAVKDMFGRTVYTYEFNNTEPRENILPGSIRRFDDSLPKRKWLGKYTVEANLGYSQGSGDLISAKLSFWYIPVWAIIVIIVVILALAGGIYWLYRKLIHGRRHHHGTHK